MNSPYSERSTIQLPELRTLSPEEEARRRDASQPRNARSSAREDVAAASRAGPSPFYPYPFPYPSFSYPSPFVPFSYPPGFYPAMPQMVPVMQPRGVPLPSHHRRSKFYKRPSPIDVLPPRRRGRTMFTDHQNLAMEQAFRRDPYLSAEARARLAKSLNLAEGQVKIWFQNRRSKQKKSAPLAPSTSRNSNNFIGSYGGAIYPETITIRDSDEETIPMLSEDGSSETSSDGCSVPSSPMTHREKSPEEVIFVEQKEKSVETTEITSFFPLKTGQRAL